MMDKVQKISNAEENTGCFIERNSVLQVLTEDSLMNGLSVKSL
jgi:hypothetical protein